jgi:AcrR family transcriptional regulator
MTRCHARRRIRRADAPSATGKPLTKRGEATRRKLLEAAEEVFAGLGYHEASIVKITERAGIGLGTFYLYFDSKQQIFEELVVDLNRRVRHSMSEAMAGATGRIEAERAGFEGFFRFTAAHPRSTASSARPSSSRPRCCACTTRASSTATRRVCAPRKGRRRRRGSRPRGDRVGPHGRR